ncbi:MAG: alpha-mannosidase [Hyphomicrobiales bacterium]|nr:MAG: alpha-mannosidase [Hyphomicrobiales bacterium]
MTYTTPLKQKLNLSNDDLKQEGKLKRLLEDLKEKILEPIGQEIDWHYYEPEIEPSAATAADWRQWPEFTPRTVWSKDQGHTWFAAEVEVPKEAAGKTFVLRFTSQWADRPGTTDPQCLAYLDGEIVQAIDGNHTELVIMRKAVPNTKVTLHVNAFTFFDRPLAGFKVEYLIRNESVESLYFNLQTPFDVASRLQQNDPRRHEIFNLIHRALRVLDRRGRGLTKELADGLAAANAIADEIYDMQDTEVQPTITAFGHTHIDIAWLWRVLHTREKGGRSFATALNLMAEYPQLKFMYNQAVLFDFIKQDYPTIWQGIKDAVARGQLEIEGAMWVEPDANIVSGESMVRQIMMGTKFHQTEFGVTPSCVWLPDTFGYSANMPQILDKSGLDYFLTSKLSWNDTDRQPYDTFFWGGIDGTEIKAHLITAQEYESDEIFTTYNSVLSVSEVMGAWKRYEPKAVHNELALCYGYGDGGGGPTREMVERGTRLERGIPGAPNLKLEGLKPFLERLGKKMDKDAERFPKWDGELYLQYHRGTLTTIGKTKLNNRLAERKMRELEYMATMANVKSNAEYPVGDLDRLWKVVLINQFHDILPGTSIPEVYKDTDAEYAALFSELESKEGAFLVAEAATRENTDANARVYNFTGQSREGSLLHLPSDIVADALCSNGKIEEVQKIHRADGSIEKVVPIHGLGSHGWTGVSSASMDMAETKNTMSVSPSHIENAYISVKFDKHGEITSVFDKILCRELIKQGKTANRLVAYEDKPMEWDAWDIDAYFEEQFWCLADEETEITVVEDGPHRIALKISRVYKTSKVVQIVSLTEKSKMIEFDTFIDWHEKQTVLKVLFPFDMNVSEVRSEIQFGHVTRPTHRNTSWDQARFETSMHRWVDMSEPDFGAALLNDCKYGYDAFEQTIRLTLVRGTTWPHPQADEGEHNMRYSLLVHDGARDLECVHHAAEIFNNPLQMIGNITEVEEQAFSFVSTTSPNVTIETIKRAENGSGVIVRLFEHANRRAATEVSFGMPVKSVRIVNLMEEEASEPMELIDGKVSLAFRPFEIFTLLVEMA